MSPNTAEAIVPVWDAVKKGCEEFELGFAEGGCDQFHMFWD